MTGPIFRGENLQSLKGRVLVPTHIFKAVFDPQQNAGAAYLVENTAVSDFKVVSLSQIQEMAGIDVFPGLPASLKQNVADLPEPRVRRRPGSGHRPEPRSPASSEIEGRRTRPARISSRASWMRSTRWDDADGEVRAVRE